MTAREKFLRTGEYGERVKATCHLVPSYIIYMSLMRYYIKNGNLLKNIQYMYVVKHISHNGLCFRTINMQDNA